MPIRRTALTFVAGILFAGCLQGAGPGDLPDGVGGTPLVADCATSGFAPTDAGVCAKFFLSRSGGQEWEPHMAAHPTDPNILLLTASNRPPLAVDPALSTHLDAVRIWAAISLDAGATWKLTTFSDAPSAANGIPGPTRVSFDSIAGFGHDGTAYVLFGGENVKPNYLTTAVRSQMTVARSSDFGVTWTLERFHENFAGAYEEDYMDMAVVPDADSVYVAADVITVPLTSAEIMFWRSQDGGRTWGGRQQLTMDNAHQFPRIAAGRDGLVVVGALSNADNGTHAGFDVWISRDEGTTFEGPRSVVRASLSSIDGIQPTVWESLTGQTRIDVGYSQHNRTYRVSSSDDGDSWSAPMLVSTAPQGHYANLHETAVGADGTWYALERYGVSSGGAMFGLNLIRASPAGVLLEELELVNKTGVPGAPYIGGHYGGLAASADGTIWAAWGDPRVSPTQIAIAALRAT